MNNSPALVILQGMTFEFNVYSSLLLPFFIQGIVVAVLLFCRGHKQERLSDTLLGWLLLLNAIKIAYWMLGWAGWYDTHDRFTSFMFYFPFNNVIWMGPLLYCYFLSLTNTEFRFRKNHLKHLLLPALFLLLVLLKFIIDMLFYRPFPVAEATQYGTKGPLADLDKNNIFDLMGYASFFYYLVITIKAFGRYQLYVKQNFSSTEEIRFGWLRNLLYAIATGVVVFFIFSLINEFVEIKHSYVFDWYSYLALGIIIYYLSVAGYFTRLGLLQQLHFIPQAAAITAPVPTAKETPPEIIAWKEKLVSFIETEKPFLDPDLNLTQLAKRLNTNTSLLSRVINEGFEQNFNDFINAYRVKTVTEKLKAGEQKLQTFLGIAYDCGFNSKATFNRAFKKFTGTSPKEWLEQNGQ